MLEELGPKIKRTAELVQEISASSRQQNSGIQHVIQSISQLEDVIQQNASASEEMASISEELASQAEMLPSAIAIVRTDEASVEQPALEYSSG